MVYANNKYFLFDLFILTISIYIIQMASSNFHFSVPTLNKGDILGLEKFILWKATF